MRNIIFSLFTNASTLANLAEGRVAILMDLLVQALSRGYTGDDPDEGQLKVTVTGLSMALVQ